MAFAKSLCSLSLTLALIQEILLSSVCRETGVCDISHCNFLFLGSSTAITLAIFFLMNLPSEYECLACAIFHDIMKLALVVVSPSLLNLF